MGTTVEEPSVVREADPLTVGDIAAGVILGLWGFALSAACVVLLLAVLSGRSIGG